MKNDLKSLYVLDTKKVLFLDTQRNSKSITTSLPTQSAVELHTVTCEDFTDYIEMTWTIQVQSEEVSAAASNHYNISINFFVLILL